MNPKKYMDELAISTSPHLEKLLVLLFCSMFSYNTVSSQIAPAGGGDAHFEHSKCLSDAEHEFAQSQVETNVLELRQKGILPQGPTESIVLFSWPLKLKTGITDPSYYAISNFVDQNNSSGTSDYNCGARTYDGHKGTDIFLWPFPWSKMDNNEVEVIAAAAGTIVAKYDGNFDRHCTWTNGAQGNAIILQHADGSQSWYWHFKKQSLTSKGVGASVAAGEFLGIAGSSGISTSPHLHFEVYNSSNQLIDPWSGPCNSLNAQSWWSGQKPYRDQKLNRLATHSAVPSLPNCPPEVLNLSTQFQPGNTIYFAAYYRDQPVNAVSNYSIRRPDGTTWQSWNHTSPDTYNASWWYWTFTLPSNAPLGTWSFRVTFSNQTTVHNFTVQGPCSSPTTNQISATSITSTSVRLNCSVTGVQAYDWRYRRMGVTTWTDLPSTTLPYYDLSGLLANTTYEYQVSVRCSNGAWSNWSPLGQFTTLNNPNPCGSATLLSCGSLVNSTTIGGVNSFSGYGCTPWPESGPERIYRVVLTSSGTLTAALSNLGNNDLDVFILNACSSNNCVVFGDDIATLNNAPAGIYFVVVDGFQGTSGNFTLTVNCPAETGNNEPCGATQVNVGSSCVFQTLSNVNSTASTYPLTSGITCSTTGMRDIWVRFTMPSSGKVSVFTTPGSLTDAVVAAYSGSSCSSLNYIGCIDDNSNGDKMPDFTLTAQSGSSIWLRIWRFNGSTGTFNLCVQVSTSMISGSNSGEQLVMVKEDDEATSSRYHATGKFNAEKQSLLLYPVPVSDWLQVELPATHSAPTADIFVYDIWGKITRQLIAVPLAESGLTAGISLDGIPAGAYALQLRLGNDIYSAKFIKL